MFTLGAAVTTHIGQGTIAGIGTTARGDEVVVIAISGRMVRFTGSDLYRISL
jgi:hypothetical protein